MRTNRPDSSDNKRHPSIVGFSGIDMDLFENVRICRDDDFKSLVARIADTSGCDFLFEIPAAMIGEHGKMAAALSVSKEEASTYCFVVVCKQTGSIELMHEADVSMELLDFVHSYTNVLFHLADATSQSEAIH